MASVMDKIKAKTAELKTQYNEIEIPYISHVNYDDFGIVETEIKTKLINYEKKAVYHANQLNKSVMELSKIFSEAQKILANHSGGTFKKWFEELGFKKDFVYMCLKRNDLFLEVRDDKVFQIPERAIKTISKIKDKINKEEIKEIIQSDKPTDKAKEKENQLSGSPTTEEENIEIIDDNIDKIRELEEMLAKYYRKIKDIEYELSILKKKK